MLVTAFLSTTSTYTQRDLPPFPTRRSSDLNKLLNEMDGLREDADVIFILTTNRPDQLEPALASRPGRIDQAIEFPLPDEQDRKSTRLNSSHTVISYAVFCLKKKKKKKSSRL